jgi:ketosteroid isomerase-like protein
MSTYRGWPERQTYPGIEGTAQFLANWIDTWHEWELQVEKLRDAGDRVVAIVWQRGRSKATGLPTEKQFAQVYTVRGRKYLRMEMYATPAEALEAAGLRNKSSQEES